MTPGQFELLPLAVTHAQAAADLQQGVMSNPWSASQFTDSIEAGHLCLGLFEAEQLAACAVVSLVLDEASLLTIACAPPWQGRGLAGELLRYSLSRARAAGAGLCFLEVRADNEQAIAVYRHIGFTLSGERKAYYATAHGRVNALLMTLEL